MSVNLDLLLCNANEWKQIPGYENYSVSKDGCVFSKHICRLMAVQVNAHGYKYIGIKKEGVRKNFLIHRLLMQLYGPSQPVGKPHINHKNGNKLDNSFENLEWCDRSENMKHSIHVLGNPKPPSHLGKIGGLSKLSKPIVGTNIKTGEKLFFASMRMADAVGFYIANVRENIANKTRHYKGYKWELL